MMPTKPMLFLLGLLTFLALPAACGADTFSYTLVPGWNSVALAVAPTPPVTRASQLAAFFNARGAHVTRVARYTGRAYESYTTTGPSPDFAVAPGAGYFVLNEGPAASPAMTGAELTVVTTTLSPGWNLLGNPKAAAMTAEGLLARIRRQGGEATAAKALGRARFVGYTAGGPSAVTTSFALEPGRAYLVKATKSSPVTLGDGTPPTIVTTALPGTDLGQTYSTTLSATGSPPVTFSLAVGALPSGLTLSASGVISGVTTDTFGVKAENFAGAVTRTFKSPVALQASAATIPGVTFLQANGKGYREFRNEKDGSVLIEIPAGSFTMGTAGQTSGEGPQHRVTLSAFFIGKYEVTNAQYAAFLAAAGDPQGPTQHVGHHPSEGASKNHTPGGTWNGHGDATYSNGDNNPVVYVDWYDAYAYCAWAGLRLPTEAEWERAARGDADGRTYPWGEAAADAGGLHRCNHGNLTTCCSADAADGFQYTAPVGSYGPGAPAPRADGSSPFGALDMSGNVWEWCRDWYDGAYYATDVWKDPTGPLTAQLNRLIRGGCWNRDADYLRAAYRDSTTPTARYYDIGFRAGR
ncbi:MAG: SUMF1/EgtB/PvdO family nonheme iron enzyme [Candidatus Riflebacteria bacterium]|nr:SUMF1/EgtB/PvdO family nonheme iron enzyme [Candidatus Riflebacteria bacterium]